MADPDKDIKRANRRGQARKAKCPAAVAAYYDDATSKVVVSLANERLRRLAHLTLRAQGLL